MAEQPKSDDLTLVVPKSFWLANQANVAFIDGFIQAVAEPGQTAEYEEGPDMVFAIHNVRTDAIPDAVAKIVKETDLSVAFKRARAGETVSYQGNGYRAHIARNYIHLSDTSQPGLVR